jgi:NhaP-type Na+/H+ or K+/H+ antiporter
LSLLAYYGSKSLGGNGFVAAFVGGLLFAYATRGRLHAASEYTEITGSLLSIFAWLVVGGNLVIPLFQQFNLRALVFALLCLTFVRMIPVALLMIGSHLRTNTIAIMGWFGPRGLASIVFLLMVYSAAEPLEVSTELITDLVSWTVLLSVFSHGLSAVALANWYARQLKQAPRDIAELRPAPEMHSWRRRPTPVWKESE